MHVTLVATRLLSSFVHEGRTYTPNERGEFEVEEEHVATARAHGLVPKGETAGADGDAKDETARLRAENAKMRAQLLKRGAAAGLEPPQ